MSESIFEPIFVGTQLSEAVMMTLHEWMPTYLAEIERQLRRPQHQIPPPKLYTTRNEFTSFPDDQMPMCVVVSPGLAEAPSVEGDGIISAWFQLGVGFAASARDADASRFLADVYAAAGRAILMQRGSLGGVATGMEYVDESYDDLVTEDERTIRASYLIFRANIWNLVTKNAGPPTPDAPDISGLPGSQWPTANIVKIDSIKLS